TRNEPACRAYADCHADDQKCRNADEKAETHGAITPVSMFCHPERGGLRDDGFDSRRCAETLGGVIDRVHAAASSPEARCPLHHREGVVLHCFAASSWPAPRCCCRKGQTCRGRRRPPDRMYLGT